MGAYYNEIDEKAAAWLRELIARGLIADGVVDTRSIEDVTLADLAGFTQCHFFAGIGVWSYALRRAGWPDDRPVWTGSCPCQPFSAAGKGGGFADERHLWPAFHWLIEQCRPPVVFGEQVASKDGLAWLDLVQADLEGSGYASRAVDFCAAGVGAPHIRQRLYWVADAYGGQRGGFAEFRGAECDRSDAGWSEGRGEPQPCGVVEQLAHHHHQGLEGRGQPERERAAERAARESGVAGGMADDAEPGREPRGRDAGQGDGRGTARLEPGRLRDAGGVGVTDGGGPSPWSEAAASNGHGHPSVAAGGGHSAHPTNGLWRDADWLLCRDGKFRPVEPGTFPLAHGAPARVGRLRGYGNGLVAAQAQAFIESWLETGASA